MRECLKKFFLVDVYQIFDDVPATAQTIVVEPMTSTIGSSSSTPQNNLGLSLVLKKHNHGKVDSQRWWLGCHVPASASKYFLQTDCGTIFDVNCIELMYQRLEMDPEIVAVACMQRSMSAEQQGEDPGEFTKIVLEIQENVREKVEKNLNVTLR